MEIGNMLDFHRYGSSHMSHGTTVTGDYCGRIYVNVNDDMFVYAKSFSIKERGTGKTLQSWGTIG